MEQLDHHCNCDQEYQTWEFHPWTLLKFPTLTFPISSEIHCLGNLIVTIVIVYSEDIIDVDIAVEDLVVKNISTFETKQVDPQLNYFEAPAKWLGLDIVDALKVQKLQPRRISTWKLWSSSSN